ncbi:hypothetical protein Tsubulata_037800 [Turnera subulata]|uniref:Pollen Ole e 1 allergen and extensin family protein n=1 Tax=Turnera subulata TaxID=218843 RepID=A0A9Q0JQV4_9ROSI|nr:hypothetical protein Tsubulata_037800 [Turnera subulata]
MSNFSGCSHTGLVMNKLIFSSIFVFFIIIFQGQVISSSSSSISMVEEGDNNINHPIEEYFSSREDLVQLAGYGEEKLSTVIVTGTVLCEACLHGESQLRAWPISGALVAIKCRTSKKWGKTSSAQAVTDEYGDFLIDLPSHLHAIPNLDRACSVKVLQMPKNAPCEPANLSKQKALKLSSVGNGIRAYTTTGDLKFLHLTSRPFRACRNRGASH